MQPLVTMGILVSTPGGADANADYRFVDREGAGRALRELGALTDTEYVARCLPCGFFDERAQVGFDRRDLVGEPGAVLVFVVAVPGLEEAAGELEAVLAEVLLGREPFGVEAEVSLEVAPACLPAFGVDLVVGPPAVGAADAGKPLAEEFLEPVVVAVGRDQEDRRLGRGRGPERAVSPSGDPACLVDVDRSRAEHRPDQGLMRLCERECAASADRVDSPDRQPDPEQLPGELGQVTARDPVARGQRHDRGLQPRPERRVGDRGREAGGRPAVAARAAQTVRPMLGHDHRDRRQLRDLTPARTPRGQLLVLAELVPAAAAAVRIVVDELVDLILGRQRTAGALMPGLTPGSAPFAILSQKLLRLRPRLGSPLLTRLRRILRRRLRPSPRTLPRLLLKRLTRSSNNTDCAVSRSTAAANSRITSTQRSRPES